MSAEREALLRAYRRELGYLRQAGARFAKEHPQIASRLRLSGEDGNDPQVERLIESFAFLTARLGRELEKGLPEISSEMLGQLYPHLVQPLPSMAIAQFEVDPQQGLPLAGHLIPKHTPLLADGPSGVTCSFRTCSPVTLWPLRLSQVEIQEPGAFEFLKRHPRVASVLRIRLEARIAAFPELELDRLRFYLDGPPGVPHALYELLTVHALDVVLTTDQTPHAPVFLPASALRPGGFDPEDAALPTLPQSHRGYRLLQEYFAFPEKFLFVELELGRRQTRRAHTVLDVLVLLDQPVPQLALSPECLRLGCTPIINLFPRTSEPIRLDPRRSEYPLIPDARRERNTEIHSILDVISTPGGKEPGQRIPPLFSFPHAPDSKEEGVGWVARRSSTGSETLPGTEVALTFVDLDFQPRLPATRTAHAQLLCTNRDLAARLPPGQLLRLEDRAPLREIRCLDVPTPAREPPLGGAALWRLVSMLSLNHRSLTGEGGLDALKELLWLHAPAQEPWVKQQLRGLSRMQTREVVRRIKPEAWRGFCRGMEVVLTFDESVYAGGSAMLLGAVLSRFLGLYVEAGSFTELMLRSPQREKRWPPMAGEQRIL